VLKEHIVLGQKEVAHKLLVDRQQRAECREGVRCNIKLIRFDVLEEAPELLAVQDQAGERLVLGALAQDCTNGLAKLGGLVRAHKSGQHRCASAGDEINSRET